jgi:hypothetical protein
VSEHSRDLKSCCRWCLGELYGGTLRHDDGAVFHIRCATTAYEWLKSQYDRSEAEVNHRDDWKRFSFDSIEPEPDPHIVYGDFRSYVTRPIRVGPWWRHPVAWLRREVRWVTEEVTGT